MTSTKTTPAKRAAKSKTTKAPPARSAPDKSESVEALATTGPVVHSMQEPLPGMEAVTDGHTADGRTVPYLEVGVRRTIAALYDMGNVQEHHAAHTAAAVTLAQIVDMKMQSERMSTVGNDMRAMIELLDRIVPEKSEMDATLKAAMDEWATAHAAGEPWAATSP